MEKFYAQMLTMKWLNFRGGHLITSPGSTMSIRANLPQLIQKARLEKGFPKGR